MKNKKIFWKILLTIGFIPFIVALIYGLYSAIAGFSGLCLFSCTNDYGFSAFKDSLILYSYVFWPTYIIGLLIIIFSIIKLKKK